MKGCVRLRRINAEGCEGSWESAERLRIGREDTFEVVIADASVSRNHAEIFLAGGGWRLRDLKSTNGTFLNGTRLGLADWPLHAHDTIKCGNVTFVLDALEGNSDGNSLDTESLVVEATAAVEWEEALQGLAFDRNSRPRPGEQLLALLPGHHLGHIEGEADLAELDLTRCSQRASMPSEAPSCWPKELRRI